jgi:hypothetical protein
MATSALEAHGFAMVALPWQINPGVDLHSHMLGDLHGCQEHISKILARMTSNKQLTSHSTFGAPAIVCPGLGVRNPPALWVHCIGSSWHRLLILCTVHVNCVGPDQVLISTVPATRRQCHVTVLDATSLDFFIYLSSPRLIEQSFLFPAQRTSSADALPS